MNAEARFTPFDAIPVDVDWPLLTHLVMVERACTQKALAADVGVKYQTLARWLNAERVPQWPACAKLLNIALSSLPESQWRECVGAAPMLESEQIVYAEPDLPRSVDVPGLVRALQSRRITYADLEREVGMSIATWSEIRSGRTPTLKVGPALALLHYARGVLPAAIYREHVH